MSDIKHTLGPWSVSDGVDGYCLVIADEKPGSCIVIAREIDNEDDARLIAAAPDLLEALDALSRSDGFAYASLFDEKEARREFAKKAIAKAEGK